MHFLKATSPALRHTLDCEDPPRAGVHHFHCRLLRRSGRRCRAAVIFVSGNQGSSSFGARSVHERSGLASGQGPKPRLLGERHHASSRCREYWRLLRIRRVRTSACPARVSWIRSGCDASHSALTCGSRAISRSRYEASTVAAASRRNPGSISRRRFMRVRETAVST